MPALAQTSVQTGNYADYALLGGSAMAQYYVSTVRLRWTHT